MIDIETFNKALETTWIKKFLDENDVGKWKLFFAFELQKLGGPTLFSGNIEKKDSPSVFKKTDPFLLEIANI